MYSAVQLCICVQHRSARLPMKFSSPSDEASKRRRVEADEDLVRQFEALTAVGGRVRSQAEIAAALDAEIREAVNQEMMLLTPRSGAAALDDEIPRNIVQAVLQGNRIGPIRELLAAQRLAATAPAAASGSAPATGSTPPPPPPPQQLASVAASAASRSVPPTPDYYYYITTTTIITTSYY